MKSLYEYMDKTPKIQADSELKEKTINFNTVEEFIKYTEDTWEHALKDSTFVKLLQKFLNDRFTSNSSEISLESSDDVEVSDLEETGVVYNGEIFGFWCTDGDYNGYSNCTITLRDNYLSTTRDLKGRYEKVSKHFSMPVTIAGKPFDEQYSFNTPKLKELSKKLLRIINKEVEDASDEIIQAYKDDDQMSDTEFHRWANPGL